MAILIHGMDVIITAITAETGLSITTRGKLAIVPGEAAGLTHHGQRIIVLNAAME
jgi:hypothetical protein